MQDAVWDELLFFQSQWRSWTFVVYCVPPLVGLLGPVSPYDCCDARRVVLVESMGKTVVHVTVEQMEDVIPAELQSNSRRVLFPQTPNLPALIADVGA
jgi:hypothetical protein